MTAAFRYDRWSEPPPERAMDIRDFVHALASRWKSIVFSMAVTTGMGLSYLAFTPTTYTSTVSILVDARPRAPAGSDPAANINAQADTILVESQVKVLSSNTVLMRVVQREGLANDPDYVGAGGGLVARLTGMIGFHAPAQVAGDDRAARAVQALARSVTVKRSERTYVIDVDVSARDPAKAARLANSVADAYLADQLDARATIVRGDAKWISQRLGELQARVQDAENRVQTYRAQHAITDANGKNVGDQEFADLSNELVKARARVIDSKSRWERYRSVVNSARINDLPAEASKSGVLDKLRGQLAEITRQESNLRTTLGDRHPALLEVESQLRDTKTQINAELKRLADAAGVEYQVALDAENQTIARVEQARKETEGRNQSSIELRELERDVDASKSVYEKFLRARENNDEQNTGGPDARVIAPAVAPAAPSSPKTAAIIFASAASGLFIGIGLALFSDYMESTSLPAGGRDKLDDDLDDVENRKSRVPVRGRALRAWRHRDNASLDHSAGGADDHPDKQSRQKSGRPDERMTRRRPLEAERKEPVLNLTRARPQQARDDATQARLYEALMGGARRSRHGRQRARVMLLTSMEDAVDRARVAVDLARYAAAKGKRALVIDADIDNPALVDQLMTVTEYGLILLNGVRRPIYRANSLLWFVPMRNNEARIVDRLLRRPDIQCFEGISDEFDLVTLIGPVLDFEPGAAELAAAADRIAVIATSVQRQPDAGDIADLLGVSPHRIVSVALHPLRGREGVAA